MININKKYKTRDGRDVRLLCTDGPGDYPVRGIVYNNVDTYSWTLEGKEFKEDDNNLLDLIEVPNTVTKTFYRRKWCVQSECEFVTDGYNYFPSKEDFDSEYAVKKNLDTWSDEWEEITVEVPV